MKNKVLAMTLISCLTEHCTKSFRWLKSEIPPENIGITSAVRICHDLITLLFTFNFELKLEEMVY